MTGCVVGVYVVRVASVDVRTFLVCLMIGAGLGSTEACLALCEETPGCNGGHYWGTGIVYILHACGFQKISWAKRQSEIFHD